MSMCPVCRDQRLQEKRLSDGKTHIDVCPGCRGGWFDAEELAAVLSVAVDTLKPEKDAVRTSRVCPKCRVPMARILYPETRIEVDVCEDCSGIWLDRGEFRGINQERARHQCELKFSGETKKPETLREAVVQFVDRVLIRFVEAK